MHKCWKYFVLSINSLLFRKATNNVIFYSKYILNFPHNLPLKRFQISPSIQRAFRIAFYDRDYFKLQD